MKDARVWNLGRPLRPVPPRPGDARPAWQQAQPGWIARALRLALERPAGGWYAVDASRAITDRPRRYRIAGRDVVAWRARGQLHFGPDTCPHMGASLADGRVCDGKLVCPWHGMALGPAGHGRWRPFAAHDDGVLGWVRMDDAEAPAERPRLPARPSRHVDAVMRMEAACEPRDVLQNRLDPWHGVHFHPHSFARLRVIERQPDAITVRVVYRIAGPLGVEVDACFHCPDRRTIAMTIVDGDGRGSVVETHATPIEAGRTAIVEAVLATSDRPGFRFARRTAALIRPWVQRAARRLWVDDAAYAERLHALRRRPGDAAPADHRAEATGRAAAPVPPEGGP